MVDSRVILYTAPNCSTSDRARADLARDGVNFEERNVMTNEDWFNECISYSIVVPVIVWPDRVEIGWKGAYG